MGGKSSGKGGSGGIEKLVGKAYKEGQPIRNEVKTNLLDILGGGSGAANLPMAQSALAQSKDATAQSLRQIDERTGTMPGVAGTPFAENISSQARIAGNQASAAIPGNLAKFFLGTFGPPAAYGTQGAALGAGGAAAQQSGNKMSALGGLGQGVGSLLGKGGAG